MLLSLGEISIPLPGSEAASHDTSIQKDAQETGGQVWNFTNLHIKHYHMSPTQFQAKDFHVRIFLNVCL